MWSHLKAKLYINELINEPVQDTCSDVNEFAWEVRSRLEWVNTLFNPNPGTLCNNNWWINKKFMVIFNNKFQNGDRLTIKMSLDWDLKRASNFISCKNFVVVTHFNGIWLQKFLNGCNFKKEKFTNIFGKF